MNCLIRKKLSISNQFLIQILTLSNLFELNLTPNFCQYWILPAFYNCLRQYVIRQLTKVMDFYQMGIVSIFALGQCLVTCESFVSTDCEVSRSGVRLVRGAVLDVQPDFILFLYSFLLFLGFCMPKCKNMLILLVG